MIGPPDATLADVAAAYADLGDAQYQADEIGDHAAEWRAQQNLDATVGRVAAREVEAPVASAASIPPAAAQSAASCLPGLWHGLGVHLRTCPAAVADGVPGATIRRWELASEARAPEPEPEAGL